MAAEIGTEDTSLALAAIRKTLFDEPYVYQFFQAVRLLERLYPDRGAVGRYANPQDEVVRFRANPTLSFPPSEIASLRPGTDGPSVMEINFMGLTGPLSVMPMFLTELVIGRQRAKDRTLPDFLSIFDHRMISFFYQAWEKHHFTVAYERDQNDPMTAMLLALVGFGTPHLRDRQPVSDQAFIHYSGLFAMAPRSAAALEAVVSDYFDVPVEVEPFIGVWRAMEPADQCVFGTDTLESLSLGGGAVVGDEIWDQQSRVRLKLGPLTGKQYGDFLPTGTAWPRLKTIVRTFYGNDVEFEIQLILKREDVPSPQLRDPAEGSLRLGWHTWMKSTPQFGRDPGDTILNLSEA